MTNAHVVFGTVFMCYLVTNSHSRSYVDDKSISEERFHCPQPEETENSDKSSQNSYSNSQNNNQLPKSKYEVSPEKSYFSRRFMLNEKRSPLGNLAPLDLETLGKRQVGVIYKDEQPIGILQPYKRTYRFIPVNEESISATELGEGESLLQVDGNLNNDLKKKREISVLKSLDESYPAILASFKIDSKLDKKRNNDLSEENVRALRSTIRKLRSPEGKNSEHFERQLKDILDDMGLIEDDEVHPEKREVSNGEDDEDEMNKSQRDKREPCHNQPNEVEASAQRILANPLNINRNDEISDKNNVKEFKRNPELDEETRRKKREKAESENELIENLKESGDLTLSGNKSPLAASSEVESRDVNSETDEKPVQAQIQDKINSLKEEVKREIAVLKSRQAQEDVRRKKRQTSQNLNQEESEDVNPVLNPENEQKPLVRKRRSAQAGGQKQEAAPALSRVKRGYKYNYQKRNEQLEQRLDSNSNSQPKEEEGGEIFDELEKAVNIKRRSNKDPEETYQENNDILRRRRRSDFYPIRDSDKDYGEDEGYRLKRDNLYAPADSKDVYDDEGYESIRPFRRVRSRVRRRISDDEPIEPRAQQLSDMSDLDLFGALPKGYSGELSRYKRVKRK